MYPRANIPVVEVSLPPDLARYLVDKGSITVDGVSLTVVEAGPTSFTVSLIPETLARTTLGSRQPGDRVNLEVDILAKHVEKLLEARLGAAATATAPEARPPQGEPGFFASRAWGEEPERRRAAAIVWNGKLGLMADEPTKQSGQR